MSVLQRIIDWAEARSPDFIIGGQEDPYLLRWFLIPRNPVFNVYVHRFLRSDDDRALHTHPWVFNCSILLEGMYWEYTPSGKRLLCKGQWKFRWGSAPHRVELLQPLGRFGIPVYCWTVFITGPRVRSWGFLCPQGFVHWRAFTDSRDKGAVGKGCAQ